MEITLFNFENSNIHINIVARFEGEDLIIDGYDHGKTVEKLTGDSDYEYNTTLHRDGVLKLCKHLRCDPYDKNGVLNCIAQKFHGNHCYSEFSDFLKKKKIDSDGFSW
ncbi:MAG: hypothetical protein NTU44_01600 [Bacteroidetes bacterium]|nr:hypothetical protein [Bacteroidota bacterium]